MSDAPERGAPGSASEPKGELRAARWEPETVDTSFRRPFPWIPVVLVTLLLVGGGVFMFQRTQREIRDLRVQLVRTHAERIGNRAGRVRSFRTRVEGMILRAAAMKHPDAVAPGFTFDSLRGRRGVYVRLREADTVSREAIAHALEIMEPDAIAHCLGITPVAMRTLYTKFAPLTGDWLRTATDSTDGLRLRVRIDEIRRYAERDLPALESIADSEYLLLGIIRGESRAHDDVDMYVFDPRDGTLRFAWNTRANGYLLTVRVAGYHAPNPSREALARSGATDCSIAAQSRTRTGEFGAASGSGPGDAGVEDAGPGEVDAGVLAPLQ